MSRFFASKKELSRRPKRKTRSSCNAYVFLVAVPTLLLLASPLANSFTLNPSFRISNPRVISERSRSCSVLFADTAIRSSNQQQNDQPRRPTGRKFENGSNGAPGMISNNHRNPNNNQNRRPPQQQNRGQNNNKNNSNRRGGGSYAIGRATNGEIIACESAMDVLQFLASVDDKKALTSFAGGGALNSVNFSTAMHRIARHSSQNQNRNHHNNNQQQNRGDDPNARTRILSDPRFALFVCSLAEAMIASNPENDISVTDRDGNPIVFKSREFSNAAWAVAKLKIAPPQTVMEPDVTQASEEKAQEASTKVRQLVYQVAKARQQGGGGSSAGVDQWLPALSELCGRLLDMTSYRALQISRPHQFELQELANIIWALGTSQRAHPEFCAWTIKNIIATTNLRVQKNEPGFKLYPQEYSNSLWALATSGITGEIIEEMLPFLVNLMEDHEAFLQSFKPQELSNTAWAVATILSKQSNGGDAISPELGDSALRIMRLAAREAIRLNGQNYKSQEISNTAWGMATVGFGMGNKVVKDNVLTNNIILESKTPDEDNALMRQFMETVTNAMKEFVFKFRSQELNNMAWAMARLDFRDDELLESISAQFRNPRRQLSSQDICSTMWSFATIGYFNRESLLGIAHRLNFDRVHSVKPQELSNMVWALSTADVYADVLDAFDTTLLAQSMRPPLSAALRDPVTRCYEAAARELMRSPHEFNSQEIKDILWSFSKAGIRYPTLFRFAAEHLVGDDKSRGLKGFSPQGLGNLAWSYAKQAQLAEEVSDRYKGRSTMFSRGRLAAYSTSCIDVGEGLLHKLFRNIAIVDIELHNNLGKLSPQDLSNSVWATAVLGLKHQAFIDAAKQQMMDRTRRYLSGRRETYFFFKGQEIANSLWSFATFNDPSPGLLAELGPYIAQLCTDRDGQMTVKSIARVFIRQELANLAWLLAVLGEYPPELVRLIYKGLLGVGENADPAYVQREHRDSGLKGSATMSLVYLRIMMDLEGPKNVDYEMLPENFPAGWNSDQRLQQRDDNGLMDDNLSLNTSKTQQRVSRAFARIGFDHIEEHVITMADLKRDHGVLISNAPIEILSLDIANVDAKIGIEMDGPAHFVTRIDGEEMPKEGRVISANGKIDYQFDWGDAQDINGATALKSRIMEKLGWRIINIPFWEWYALNSDPDKEDEFCRSLLEQIK